MTGLAVRGLRVTTRRGREVVGPVDLDVRPGEILGLVGESGSGKTTLGLALLGYARRGLRIAAGEVQAGGVDVLRLPPGRLRGVRGATVSYVPQDPPSALNPALTIGRQLRETLDAHGYGSGDRERRERVAETLRDVLLPDTDEFLRRYPHQLSGGQQQRVVLAIAFACRPAVIVLDEPTTGLDVTTQAHVLSTVREMARSYGTAAVYVTHDLAVVSNLADRTAVMYAGAIVEEGPTAELFLRPAHPYTGRLIAAIPRLDGPARPEGLPGRAPSPGQRPPGCAFEPRCPIAVEACRAELPAIREVEPGHRVRCIRPRNLAPAEAAPSAEPGARAGSQPVLEVRGLDAWYGDVQVLHDIELAINPGECVALVGESGSGKTTLARAIAGLHRQQRGEVLLAGAPLAPSARERPQDVRRRIQYVFQNPYSSLNPRRPVGESIGRPLALAGVPRAEVRARVREMLERVALTPAYADRYPDQMSGGERQRVAIARALVADPEVVICDEVTSALDVSVQAMIIDLLAVLQRDLGVALLFVTHNLPLVRSIASRAAVMQSGRIVEAGPAERLIAAPESAYARELIANTPVLQAPAPAVPSGG